MLRSAIGATRATEHAGEVRSLIDFLVSEPAQSMLANVTFAYPVREGVPVAEPTQHLGDGQPGVTGGKFKARNVPLAEITRHREEVIRMLDEVKFDRPR